MPPASTGQRIKQLAQGFLGVNLRKDRVTLADEELAKAINADLHERPGSILLRLGRRKQFDTPLADLEIRRLALVNGVRYAVAGQSLYRDEVKIINGLLSPTLFTTMVPFRPFADPATWLFIADEGVMRKDDGTRLVPWGLAAPPAPVLGIGAMGTTLTGVYRAGYSLLRHVEDAIAHESIATEAANPIALTAQHLAIGDIGNGGDDQVTGVGLYRSVGGGTLLLLDSRQRFPTQETSLAVVHGWEVAATIGGTTFTGLQMHWTLDKSTHRGTQSWEPEVSPGLRLIGAAAVHGTSLTLPAHQAGDLIVMFVLGASVAAIPVPAGWSTWGAASASNPTTSTAASVGVYKVATSDSEVSDTWGGAIGMVAHVYRGQRVAGAIGGVGDTGGNSTTVTYPALALTDSGGTSVVAGFAGHRMVNTILEVPPTGMVHRAGAVGGGVTGEVAGHDTDGGATSWPSTAVYVGGTANTWRAKTLEIRAEPTSSDSAGSSEDVNGRRATHLWEALDSTLVTTQTKRWAYASVLADGALGAEAPTDNAVPPAASWVTEYDGHLVLVRLRDNRHHLRWSDRFAPESWSDDNLLEIGNPNDPLQCAVPLAGILGIFSRNTKYRVTRSAGGLVYQGEALSRRGTTAPLAVIPTEYGIVFPHHDGIFRTNLLAQDEELSAEIEPLFADETVNDMPPINWAVANTFSAMYRKGRYYFAYAAGAAQSPDTIAVLSRTTGKWYFFDHPARCLDRQEGDDEALVAGFTDGLVYILEDGPSDAGGDIALEVETKDYFGGDPDVRKLFLWIRVDADVPTGTTLFVDLYVDGALKRTAAVTGTRRRALVAFPEGSLGYTWRLRFRYTGQTRVRIYGASAIMLPLESS